MADQDKNDRKRDDKPDDAAPKKPQSGGSGIDDRTSKAQEEAAKERAREGGYQ
ncbi:MAG TPA: hypothetical protein VGE72_07520 [Azospirillum sp.]